MVPEEYVSQKPDYVVVVVTLCVYVRMLPSINSLTVSCNLQGNLLTMYAWIDVHTLQHPLSSEESSSPPSVIGAAPQVCGWIMCEVKLTETYIIKPSQALKFTKNSIGEGWE